MKPFSIQAPEDVAKEYGGNKQKIMQAAQMGVVDPTAAVLAGMFIDRMRNAAQTEQVNPPTIAQQVMGGTPPGAPPPGAPPGGPPGGPPGAPSGAPPGGPQMPPAGGLGATPEAMGGGMPPPMPPPPGGLSMPPPSEGPPMGMAGGGEVEKVENVNRALEYLSGGMPFADGGGVGGLDSIPVADSMFGGDYAGGGIVAFATGGTPNYRQMALEMLPAVIDVESGGLPRPGVPTQYGTAQGIAQMLPATAQGMAKKIGVPYDFALLSGTSPDAINYQKNLAVEYLAEGLEKNKGDPDAAAAYYIGGPNKARHGPKTRDYVGKVRRASGRQGATGKEDYTPLEEVDIDTREGRTISLEDRMNEARERINSLPKEESDALKAAMKARMDPAARKKERSRDLWSRLAEFGANLASTPGDLLSAAGTAAKEPLKGITADVKARKAEEDADLDKLLDLENAERADQFKAMELGTEAYKADLGVEGDAKALAAREREGQLDRDARMAELKLQMGTQLRIANTEAMARGMSDVDRFGTLYNNALDTLLERTKQGRMQRSDGLRYHPAELKRMAGEMAEQAMRAPPPASPWAGAPGISQQGGGGAGGDAVHLGAIQ